MGADVRSEDHNGLTALLRAVSCGHIELVRLLIEKGQSDVNHKDKKGRTALHPAILHGNNTSRERMIRLLIRKKIKIDAKDEDGKTAVDLGKRPLRMGFVKGPSSKSLDTKPEVREPTRDSPAAIACKGHKATLAEFFFDGTEESHNFQRPSIHELLYGSRAPRSILKAGRADEKHKNKKPRCWWYHLLANNVRHPRHV